MDMSAEKKKAELRMEKLSAEIDELEARAKQADADVRSDLLDSVEKMKTRRDEAADELSQMKNETSDNVVQFFESAERALGDVENGLRNAARRFG